MANGYSKDDLLEFLSHASEKGLMPAATSTALGVASRNILGMLDASEAEDLRKVDIDATIRRFTIKRARDFTPSSLKEYERRLHRAIGLFLDWRDDPANFTVKTRATSSGKRKDRPNRSGAGTIGGIAAMPGGGNVTASGYGSGEARANETRSDEEPPARHDLGGYRSAFPVRPGIVVTVSNIPADLTPEEAERLAKFIKMLAIEEQAP